MKTIQRSDSENWTIYDNLTNNNNWVASQSRIIIKLMYRVVKNLLYFSNSFDAHKNYYKILNVSETATSEVIKSSYKTLVKLYHPDVNMGKEEQFKEVNEAYQILSD